MSKKVIPIPAKFTTENLVKQPKKTDPCGCETQVLTGKHGFKMTVKQWCTLHEKDIQT